DRQAARLPAPGAGARGQHHRLQGERRRHHRGGDRRQGRAGEDARADREPGVKPFPLVLSSPSGGGKTTIARALTAARDDVGYSGSASTRVKRPGEEHGRDYFFISRGEFERKVKAGEFLEWAEYGGNLYGTLRHQVQSVLASGRCVVLDVEVQGARNMR